MARLQTDEPLEPLEELVAKANAQAKAEREAANAPSPFPCKACGYAGPCKVDMENPDELRKLAKKALAEIINNNSKTPAIVPAVKELLDRIDGKAPQSIALQADINSTSVHFDIKGGAELITQGIREKLERRRKQLALKPQDVV